MTDEGINVFGAQALREVFRLSPTIKLLKSYQTYIYGGQIK